MSKTQGRGHNTVDPLTQLVHSFCDVEIESLKDVLQNHIPNKTIRRLPIVQQILGLCSEPPHKKPALQTGRADSLLSFPYVFPI